MIRLLLVLAIAAAAYGYERIVGGSDTTIENYNHQISLEYHRSHRCGGSLIRANVVVTAAHCVDGIHWDKAQLRVRAGSSTLEKGGQVLNVKSISQEPRYDKSTIDYDVAVLILNGEFRLGDNVGTIDLIGRGDVISVGTVSDITGWGTTEEGGKVSKQLQVVTIPNIDSNDCAVSYDPVEITSRMSCWGFPEGGKDACQGDSGGPLVIYNDSGKAELAGVVSWGAGCARPEYPGVYTAVTNEEIHDFITENSNIS